MKKILAAAMLLVLSSFASAQLFPPGPYGSSSASSSGGGGGGGSTTGKINNAAQFDVGYYSVAGSSNVISGNTNFVYNATNSQVIINEAHSQASEDLYLGANGSNDTQMGIDSASGDKAFIRLQDSGVNAWQFGNDGSGALSGDGADSFYYYNYGTGSIALSIRASDGRLNIPGAISVASTTVNGVPYTWPGAQGSASTVLTNNGSGALTWSAAGGGTPAGSQNQIQINENGAFAATSMLTFSTASTGGFMTVSTGTIFAGTTALTVDSNGSGKLNLVLTAPTGVSAVERIIRGSNDGGASALQFSDFPGANVWQLGMANGANPFSINYNGSITPFTIDTTGQTTIATSASKPLTITETTAANYLLYMQNTAGTSYVYEDVPAGAGASYRFSEAGALKWYLYKDTGNPPNFDIVNGVSGNITMALNGSTDEVDTFGKTGLGTTSGTGTQVYRCSGGTDAGWVLYGNSGAAQTLCTGGGGSLVATGVYLP